MTAVTCASLVTPLGYTAAATCTALRAGIAAFEDLEYLDADDVAIRGASVDAIGLETRGRARLAALARLVVEQIDPDLAGKMPWAQMPLILCTRHREMPGPRQNGILDGLEFPDGSPLKKRRTAHVAAGQSSAFAALMHARQMLDEGGEPGCLVLAVDSLIDARTLAWLDGQMRLKTSRTTDGLIPGEAAGVVIVSRQPLSQPHLIVRGIGHAKETATAANEEPFRAEGLTAALKAALREAGTEMHDVAFRLSDVAGESYAFEELVLAQTRNMRKTRPEQPVWHAADCLGDTGAAAGLIQLAWAEHAYHRGYAPGDLAALHGSSMAFADRAAAIVSAVAEHP